MAALVASTFPRLASGQRGFALGGSTAADGWAAAQTSDAGTGNADSLAAATASSLDVVVAGGSVLEGSCLQNVMLALKPGGTLSFVTSAPKSDVSMALLLGGFVDVVLDEAAAELAVRCQKPGWELGASAPVPRATDAPKAGNVWKLMASDFAAEGEIEDEDALLNDDVPVRAAAAGDAVMDCGTGGPGTKRRACKNCTCGLKDMEGNPAADFAPAAAEDDGGCNSCGKGDAFRCATCPYLGTPSFDLDAPKPAIKIQSDGTKVLLEI